MNLSHLVNPRNGARVWQWIAAALLAFLLAIGSWASGGRSATSELQGQVTRLREEQRELEIVVAVLGDSHRSQLVIIARDRAELLDTMRSIDAKLNELARTGSARNRRP